jgi:hypothetical protein
MHFLELQSTCFLASQYVKQEEKYDPYISILPIVGKLVATAVRDGRKNTIAHIGWRGVYAGCMPVRGR